MLDAASGRKAEIQVFGTDYDTRDGSCVRDYIHVSDLASAHLLALHYLENGKESDYFNLGNEQGSSVFQVLDSVRRVTGRDFNVVYGARRFGDPAVLVGSCQKAKAVLGWKPQYNSLDEIVEHAWKWHQKKGF